MVKDIVSEVYNYRDAYGLITQKDTDGGDTACRTGVYYALLGILKVPFDDVGRVTSKGLEKDISRLTVGDEFVRHPKAGSWWSNPRCFSRDQHSMLMLAAAANNRPDLLARLAKPIIKRGGFHQNDLEDTNNKWKIPDLLTPGELSVYIRGMRMKLLYPILYLTDILLIADNYFRTKQLWDSDNLIAARLMYEQQNWPTFLTEINCYLYAKNDHQDRIRFNYSAEKNGIPPLGELYTTACEMRLEWRTKEPFLPQFFRRMKALLWK